MIRLLGMKLTLRAKVIMRKVIFNTTDLKINPKTPITRPMASNIKQTQYYYLIQNLNNK